MLLTVNNLSTHFHLSSGLLKAVDGVDFSLGEGQTLALVGESGCGKSVTAYSILRLVSPPGKIESGTITFDGIDILKASEDQMRQLRGNLISMIFQEPMTSLNPVLRIGEQVMEGLLLHRRLSYSDARGEVIRLLDMVGIPSAAARFDDYPHRLSGGMRQRVIIAMALACRPRLLIADEPTTALDVTIQAQILTLIDQLRRENNMSMILITHDLGIVAERSEVTAVMYAGRIVEQASTSDIISAPLHPYTRGLLNSLPQNAEPGRPLKTIPGQVPDLFKDVSGCGFCDRCPDKSWICSTEKPAMKEVSAGHQVRCWKYS